MAKASKELTMNGEQVESGPVLQSVRSLMNCEASKKLHIGWWVSRYKEIAEAAWSFVRDTDVQKPMLSFSSRASQYLGWSDGFSVLLMFWS